MLYDLGAFHINLNIQNKQFTLTLEKNVSLTYCTKKKNKTKSNISII